MNNSRGKFAIYAVNLHIHMVGPGEFIGFLAYRGCSVSYISKCFTLLLGNDYAICLWEAYFAARSDNIWTHLVVSLGPGFN